MEEIFLNPELSTSSIITIVIVMIWSIVWKGIALWKSARLSHKKWFVVLLVLNTVGILEIIYVYFIASKYSVETIDDDSMSKTDDSEKEEDKESEEKEDSKE